ncbi:hypothetical protein DRO21_06115, partial [archaeon]
MDTKRRRACRSEVESGSGGLRKGNESVSFARFSYLLPDFEVERKDEKCIRCRVCERQCAFGVHRYDEELDRMFSAEEKCVGCQRCVVFCPTNALAVFP